jgi:ABC-2 type transport system ATP-binding protein
VLRALEAAGVGVTSAEVRRPTLDDVFLRLTGHRLRDDGDLAAGNPPVAARPSTTTELQEAAS